jgi:hypothetical protein
MSASPKFGERSNPCKRGPTRRQKSPALVSLGGASVGGKAKLQLVPRQTTPRIVILPQWQTRGEAGNGRYYPKSGHLLTAQ